MKVRVPKVRYLRLLLLCWLSAVGVWSLAQEKTIGGTVTDVLGEPLPGVNVSIEGTTTGSVTDADGRFSLQAEPGQRLVASFIGYDNQSVLVTEASDYPVTLEESSSDLEEVVVVGYGTQKKKLVTGANFQVGGEQLSGQTTTTALGALQSLAPGVQITQSSGQAGEDYKVNIRGLGTIGNSEPLYVVDGVAGGSLSDLNPGDIESIDVLKDAASAAIYGARAANGVILVTTRQAQTGSKQKVNVTYDGYVGWQTLNTNDVEPLNAEEYMVTIDRAKETHGEQPYEWDKLLPADLLSRIKSGEWSGTNWLDEARNDHAVIQNHAVGISTSGERSAMTLGFTWMEQNGTLGYPATPRFRRCTVRLNSQHTLLKLNNADIIRLGENITYTNRSKRGVRIAGIYDNHIKNLLTATPLLPCYNEEGEFYSVAERTADGWTYDPEQANPLAKMSYQNKDRKRTGNRLQSNFWLEVNPCRVITLRANAGYHFSQWSEREYQPTYELNSKLVQTEDVVRQEQQHQHRWSEENTIEWHDSFAGSQVSVLFGQSIEKWGLGDNVSAKSINSLFPGSFEHAYIGNTEGVVAGKTEIGGEPLTPGALASFFGRVNYNYKERYLFSFILRGDGSSNFAEDKRWGCFPSVSAGWVMTEEPFMARARDRWLDFLKLRFSWGRNGNADIDPFQYLATIAFDESAKYYYTDKNTGVVGAYPDILPNPDVTWETSQQTDVGLDARLFRSRLTLAFDWYKKVTKDWLVRAPQLLSYGTGAPYVNGGDIKNTGVELALGWSDKVGKFGYNVSVNLSTNRNEVTRIANNEGIIHGPVDVMAQNTKEFYRAAEGEPIGYFWGYETAGVFQNQAEIDAWLAAGKATMQKPDPKGENPDRLQPGDLIFVDRNGDGKLDEQDKTKIGDPNPHVRLGVNIGLSFAGIDFTASGYGAFGHDIVRCYRQFSNEPNNNYTNVDLDGLWDGEGSTNSKPRFSHGKAENFNEVSDFWVQAADYFKINNFTLGYDFHTLMKPSVPISKLRLFVKAQNAVTITKYDGMDPEVGYGGPDAWASGLDIGYYPDSRAFLVGLNLHF